MMRHLEDDQIAAAVAGLDLEPDARSHLASCLSCRQQVEEMNALIDSRRQELLSGEPDWEQQREEILMRLPGVTEAAPSKKWRWMRPVLAAAAVLLMVIGVRTLWVPEIPGERPVGDEIAVEEILAEVDAVLADDYLPGFESIDPGVSDPESMIENGAS